MNLTDLLIVDNGVLKRFDTKEKPHDCKCVELPNTIHEIENYAFFNDKSLKYLILPSSVETIKKHAMCQCYEVKKVFIPKSVKIMEEVIIHRCSKDLEIYLEGEPQEGWIDCVEKKIIEDKVITDEDNAFNFHRSSGGWSYTLVKREIEEEHHWNDENYKVHYNVTKEEFLKLIEQDNEK